MHIYATSMQSLWLEIITCLDSDPEWPPSPPPFCVFLHSDCAGPCPTPSLFKLLPNEGNVCSRNDCCLRQQWGQQRKCINVDFHLIHTVLFKKSLNYSCSKEIFTYYIFHLYPAAIQSSPCTSLHHPHLTSNPKMPLNFLCGKIQLTLFPSHAHPRYL